MGEVLFRKAAPWEDFCLTYGQLQRIFSKSEITKQMKRFTRSVTRSVILPLFALVALLPLSRSAQAGVFNIPHFVTPGEFAVGIEPELTLSSDVGSGAGLGVNAKFTAGVSELSNLTGIIGTGGGPRKFRVGGNYTFDFFPDIAGQPGIGIALQGLYYRVPDRGQLELTGIPYVHKTFVTGEKNEFEPFVAVPVGAAFSQGEYHAISSVVVGGIFKNTENFRYIMEFGIAVNRADTYLSGGIVYYH
jgi:hypothetical protein